MKNYYLFKILVSGIIATGAISACSEVADAISGETCEVALTGSQCNGNTVKACADYSGGWYEVNGNNVCSFNSDPSSCANQVVSTYCQRSKTAEKSENNLMQDLLVTKSSNINLQLKINDLTNAINQDLNSTNEQKSED